MTEGDALRVKTQRTDSPLKGSECDQPPPSELTGKRHFHAGIRESQRPGRERPCSPGFLGASRPNTHTLLLGLRLDQAGCLVLGSLPPQPPHSLSPRSSGLHLGGSPKSSGGRVGGLHCSSAHAQAWGRSVELGRPGPESPLEAGAPPAPNRLSPPPRRTDCGPLWNVPWVPWSHLTKMTRQVVF